MDGFFIKKTAFLTLSDHETPHSGKARLTGAEPIKPDSQNRHFSDAPELSAHVEARALKKGSCLSLSSHRRGI
jgi:hypothetical protein